MSAKCVSWSVMVTTMTILATSSVAIEHVRTAGFTIHPAVPCATHHSDALQALLTVQIDRKCDGQQRKPAMCTFPRITIDGTPIEITGDRTTIPIQLLQSPIICEVTCTGEAASTQDSPVGAHSIPAIARLVLAHGYHHTLTITITENQAEEKSSVDSADTLVEGQHASTASQLESGNRQLESDNRQLESGNRQLESGNRQLESGNRQLESGNRQLESGNRQLESGNRQLESGNRQLESGNRQLESGNRQLESGNRQLESGNRQLESGNRQLESGNRQLESGNRQLESGNRQLESGNRQLESGNRQLESGNRQLESGNRQLESGNRQLESGNRQLAETHNRLLEVIAKLEQRPTLDAVNRQLHEQEQKLVAIHRAEQKRVSEIERAWEDTSEKLAGLDDVILVLRRTENSYWMRLGERKSAELEAKWKTANSELDSGIMAARQLRNHLLGYERELQDAYSRRDAAEAELDRVRERQIQLWQLMPYSIETQN